MMPRVCGTDGNRHGHQKVRLWPSIFCGTCSIMPYGGFPSLRHNEIRDLTANLLSEVCNNISIEPHLQPLSEEHLFQATANSQDGARLDVAANRLWGGRYEQTYLDIRVFNPLAPPNWHCNPSSCYRKHKNQKKRAPL